MALVIEPKTLHVVSWREGGLLVDAWCLDPAEAAQLAKRHGGSVEHRRVPWPLLVPEPHPKEEPPW
ncbi:MAG: hypothetical protein M0005_14970 [Actinomycetota bacterium]|jgi:hypothetical protein|nr:hypothetical protein [Actinomycetota bacterium]